MSVAASTTGDDHHGTADLHTHSTASDGRRTPSELVAEAKAAGLAAIGLTDHDSVAGVAEALHAAGPDLRVVAGIELSATDGDTEVHLLGYLVDPTSPTLMAALAAFREMRLERLERFVARLAAIGVPVTLAEVMAEAGEGAVGRPHIARAMIRRGYVSDVGDAFARYLAAGQPGYVEKATVTPEACIDLIRASGGVAVLAHPYSTGDPAATATRLGPLGLGGLEVEYGAYDATRRADLREIAARLDLVPTGGSDYHGAEHREHNRLGDGHVPPSTIAALAQRAGR